MNIRFHRSCSIHAMMYMYNTTEESSGRLSELRFCWSFDLRLYENTTEKALYLFGIAARGFV